MATNYKITYKNHCTPQEYINATTRWYLDSDVGAKLTGSADATFSITTQPTYAASTTLVANAATSVSIGAIAQDFVFIKNLGLQSDGTASTSHVEISLDGTSGNYRIRLAPDECFVAEIGQASAGTQDNDVYVRTILGTTDEQTVQIVRVT
jgi:hypothetical protein